MREKLNNTAYDVKMYYEHTFSKRFADLSSFITSHFKILSFSNSLNSKRQIQPEMANNQILFH